MDFGVYLRGAYLDRFFPADAPPAIEFVDAITASRLLFASIEFLRPRLIAISDFAIDEAFDDEADSALEQLAVIGDFSAWDDISAGAWAILYDRIQWSLFALTLDEVSLNFFKMGLPKDAPERVRQLATLLWLLGGPGRTPSDQWRQLQSSEKRNILLSSSFSRQ